MKRLACWLALPLLFSLVGLVPAQEKPPAKPKAEERAKGYIPPSPEKAKQLHAERRLKHGDMMAKLVKSVTPPAEFDLKDLGLVGDAGDQGSCGSCYLYSTVKTATSSAVKAGYGKVDKFRLSPQFGMDSPRDFGGCNGGNGTEVIDWMCKHGWVAEADPSQDAAALYPPYEARSGRDRTPTGAKKFTPKSWAFITSDQGDHPATVEEYKAALLTFGRVNVALDAGGEFGSYQNGVISRLGRNIDHEINVRGWSDAKQALLLENQWAGWGGAKSPGDNCAWVSYKAVGDLQDPFIVFFETVGPQPGAPAITSATTANGVVGTGFNFQVAATNYPTGFTATGLPAGISINEKSGILFGTPSAEGTSAVALTATNAAGTGTGILTISVTKTPVIPPIPPSGVTIPLTSEQVASVNAQSGAVVISGGMTLQQLADLVNKQSGYYDKNMTIEQLLEAVKKSKTDAGPPTKTDCGDAAKLAVTLEAIKADNAKLKEAINELMKASLKKPKE